jgi:hypothetical protein
MLRLIFLTALLSFSAASRAATTYSYVGSGCPVTAASGFTTFDAAAAAMIAIPSSACGNNYSISNVVIDPVAMSVTWLLHMVNISTSAVSDVTQTRYITSNTACTVGQKAVGHLPTTAAPAKVCFNSCEYDVSQAVQYITTPADIGYVVGTSYFVVGGLSNGNSCTAGTPSISSASTTSPTNIDTIDSCTASGQGYISINGKTQCVASNTASGVAAASSVAATSGVSGSGSNPYPKISIDTGGGGSANGGTTVNVTTPNPCESNPSMIGCSTLGAPPAQETIPTSSPTFDLHTVTFSGAGTCPADIPLDVNVQSYHRSFTISYKPLCDFTGMVRPIFLALGSITAAIVFAAGVLI